MTGPRTSRGTPEGGLAVIRIAMLTGVLMFGAVIWFLHRQSAAAAADPEGVALMARVLPFVFGAAVAGLLALRAISSKAEPAKQRALTIVGWAAGELGALAGGAYYLLSRDPQWYVVGVMLLVAAYVVLPIRRTGG